MGSFFSDEQPFYYLLNYYVNYHYGQVFVRDTDLKKVRIKNRINYFSEVLIAAGIRIRKDKETSGNQKPEGEINKRNVSLT